MYYLDRQRGHNGRTIYKVKQQFDYPLQRDKNGHFKVKSGMMLRVCMTSDFFLEEADAWREEVWSMMEKRPDVIFFLLTKRPERVARCLPKNWGNGWEHIFFNVTAENQARADERLPYLLELPFRHKGVLVAPFIGRVSLKAYLETQQIEQVVAGGENYDGARPLHYEWVKALHQECVSANVRFCFMETGTRFVKNGKCYHLSNKRLQSITAFKSGLQHAGQELQFRLQSPQLELLYQYTVPEKSWSTPCQTCGSRLICNGCQHCNHCYCDHSPLT